jgi:hypothetical protein
MMRRLLFLVALSAFSLASSRVNAGAVINFDPTQLAGIDSAGPYTLDVGLDVGPTNQLITALGGQAYGPGGADLGLTTMQVGLWDSQHNLLASVTVTSSDTLIGTYRYVTLNTPITLTANAFYFLGALVGGDNPSFVDSYGYGTYPFSSASGFTIDGNWIAVGPTLTAPNSSDGGVNGNLSPANALTQDAAAVPEPSTITLALIGGIFGFGALARSRGKASA